MGLPSKKQLHKHKRGTRKALNTLDAMDLVDENAEKESKVVEKLIEKKKTKTTRAKAKTVPKSKETNSPKTRKNSKKEQQNSPISTTGSDANKSSDSPTQKNNEINMDPIKDQGIVLEDNSSDFESAIDADEQLDSSKGKEEEQKSITSSPQTTEKEVTADNSEVPDMEFSEDSLEDTQKDKYLTFQIADESFGVAITHVTEIIVIQSVTVVPDTSLFVKGVINLRGKVIPVIDIRQRFGLEFREYDERTCIIVVDCQEISVGMIVDTVNEVVDIPETQIDSPPRSHSGIESSYIAGMGKIGKQVSIILNIEKVLFVEELLAK
jgi:purine-binding chemotaxis protein CheW